MHDFRLLSPLDFELLVRDLLQAEFGILLESFGPGKDGGIDFRFAGEEGDVIVQAKHYIDSGVRNLVAAARKEAPKVARLRPARYILATSIQLSDAQKTKLIAALPGVPLRPEDIFSGKDFDNMLGRHPRVLRQHLKLWLTNTETLERILRAGIYNRTEAEFEVVRAHMSRYVPNQSVADAEAILEECGALVISGQPGVGKTTLMRMLMCLHVLQGWQVFVVEDLKEAMDVFNGGEKRLVVFDDFLGQIRLGDVTVREADRSLPRFLQRVRGRTDLRFILTTRDYLLSQAQLQSDRLHSAEVSAAELVLNVGKYTRAIRSHILFNHIYFSDLTSTEKRELLADDYYLEIIDHPNFNPRLIEEITSSDYLALQSGSVREVTAAVLANPAILWKKPYEEHISEDCRRVLQALFFSYVSMPLDELERAFANICAQGSLDAIAIERLRFRRAVKPLEKSMISISDGQVAFSNPGVMDFLEQTLLDDRLFRPLLGCMSSFEMLTPAWSFYVRNRGVLGKQDGDKSMWMAAIDRCQARDRVSTIRVVEAILMVADGFRDDDELLWRAVGLMPALQSASPQPADAAYYYDALGHLAWLSWEHAHELDAIAASASDLLHTYGAVLQLEDIQGLAVAIDDIEWTSETGKEAGRAALRAWLAENLKPALDNEGLEDLEFLSAELEKVAEVLGVHVEAEQLAFAVRREELEGEDSEQERATYSPTRWGRAKPDYSDDEIKSLFSTILL